jgi:predicted RNA binding protein YcfA (HicA-like mRNA interferase family)
MSNDPSVTAKDFIKVLKKLNSYLDRQKWSHAIYKNDKHLCQMNYTSANWES